MMNIQVFSKDIFECFITLQVCIGTLRGADELVVVEAKHRIPQARIRLEVAPALIVEDIYAGAVIDDHRAGLVQSGQIRKGMQESTWVVARAHGFLAPCPNQTDR